MKEIYINGIGISSALGNSIEELFFNINHNNILNKYKIENISNIANSKSYRRLDRFSKISFNSVFSAIQDSKLEFINKDKIGTVFNTTYGPGVTNMNFAEFVAKGDPDLVSPAVFTNTVINACLGHICTYYGFKGVSTMLLCSNSIGYSMRLLENCKATDIFTGGIEEYNKEIFEGFKDKGYSLIESAITLLLSKKAKTNCYSKLLSYHEENLLKHPYIDGNLFNDADGLNIKRIMSTAIKKSQLDKSDINVVVTTMDNLSCYKYEKQAINSLFNDNIPKIEFKNIFGDFLGSSSHFGILLASEIIRKQVIPEIFNVNNINNIKKILVNNYDKDGSFTSFVVSTSN